MVNLLPPEFDFQTLRRSDVASFPRSNALFIRSCRSLSKECLRTLLKSEGPTLFLKTAGCVGMSNQILNQHLEPLPFRELPSRSPTAYSARPRSLKRKVFRQEVTRLLEIRPSWGTGFHSSRFTSHQSRVTSPIGAGLPRSGFCCSPHSLQSRRFGPAGETLAVHESPITGHGAGVAIPQFHRSG